MRLTDAGIHWVLGLIVAILAVPATALNPDDAESKLQQLRNRIQTLERELNEARGQRNTVREELHDHEQRINDILTQLKQLDTVLAQKTRELEILRQRATRERTRLAKLREQLNNQIRATYVLGREEYLKLLLNQQQPSTVARLTTYYRYLNEARMHQITTTQSVLVQLKALETDIAESIHKLRALHADRTREQQAFETAQARRVELLASLNQQVTGRSEEIERLSADRERLERLIKELATVLPETSIPFPTKGKRFSQLRGQLPLPVAGRITAKFGDQKDIGDLTWRGIFVATSEGRSVFAVFRGRVVYAGWLRGFGLLLILDHGDGYMTLYGHNQGLFKRAGDWVEAGQVIAAAGSTGDAPATGVYFEIRHNGNPSDPLRWCAVTKVDNRK